MLVAAVRRDPRPFPWREVAFVADLAAAVPSAGPTEWRDDLERTEPRVLVDVLEAISDLGLVATHIETPAALAALAADLRDSVVLSTYAGGRSRSRLTHVPAIAEALGLDFVGLDALGHALAHDKEVMKRIAVDVGVATPRWRVIRSDADAMFCRDFPVPYVAKPLNEGSSIGIGQRNLVSDPEQGAALVRELLVRFRQPVMMEAFVGGREVSLVSIEALPAAHQCLVEVAVADDPHYFATHLFDADEKLHRRLNRGIRNIDGSLAAKDHFAIARLLEVVGHYGAVRVDGKLTDDGQFHFLELTPDPWLGKTGHVAKGFMSQGWTYPDVIHAILASARLAPRGRFAND